MSPWRSLLTKDSYNSHMFSLDVHRFGASATVFLLLIGIKHVLCWGYDLSKIEVVLAVVTACHVPGGKEFRISADSFHRRVHNSS